MENKAKYLNLDIYSKFLNPYADSRGKVSVSPREKSCPACITGKLTWNIDGFRVSCWNGCDLKDVRKALLALAGEESTFVPYSIEQRRAYAVEQAELRELERLELVRRLSPSDQRHSEMLKRIAGNPLTSEAKRNLLDRGISLADQRRYGFHMHFGGWSAPSFNIAGKLSSGQYKHWDGGYRWCDAGKIKRRETGQNPLTVLGNRVNPTAVVLVEGMTVKPILTAIKHPNWLVIGASGGQFVQSSRELTHILQLFPDLDIIFMPDGGSTQNKNVMKQVEATNHLVSLANREMLIGWWGQYVKGGADIDEISFNTQIQKISYNQFLSYGNPLDKAIDNLSQTTGLLLNKFKIPTVRQELAVSENEVDLYYKGSIESSYEFGDESVTIVDASDMTRAIEELATLGTENILCTSATGQGKSTLAASIRSRRFTQVIYVSKDSRNVTTREANNFLLMPSRSKYIYISKEKETAAEEPVRKAVAPTDLHNWDTVAGNCEKTAIFAQRSALNYASDGNKSPCSTCRFSTECSKPPVEGESKSVGYNYQKAVALKAPYVRVHPTQLILFKDVDLTNTLIVFDDCSFSHKKSLNVTLTGIMEFNAEIRFQDPTLFSKISPLTDLLYVILKEEQEKYGLDHKRMIERITSLEDFEATKEMLDRVMELLTPDFSKDPEGTVIPNWMGMLLEVVLGTVHGTVSCRSGEIVVDHRDYTQQDAVKGATKLFLDATQTKKNLSIELGIDQEEVKVISEIRPNYSNLSIVVIKGAGTPNKSRRTDNVEAVKAVLEAKHGQGMVAVLDKKGKGDGTRGVHFRDSRGSNEYSKMTAILSVGIICPNMGAIANDYSLFTGRHVSVSDNDEGFLEYNRSRSAAEEIQCVGRTRSTHRQTESLTHYIWADTPNLPLEAILAAYPGCIYKEIQMIDLCPEAAKKGDRLRLAVYECVKRLGENATVTNIAQKIGVCKATISKACKQFGGFKDCLLLLLKISIAKVNTLNSEATDWNSLLVNGTVDYTIESIDGELSPLDTAIRLEAILSPMSQGQIDELMSSVGMQRKILIQEHLSFLNLTKLTDHQEQSEDKMRLIDSGDNVEDLAEGLRYIASVSYFEGLAALRDSHSEDKESLHLAAALLSSEERAKLRSMIAAAR